MKRRSPKAGYEFSQKRNYRRCVWALSARQLGSRRAAAHALLMPSSEGTEIEVALSKGFREENLHIVDENPAIVANLKRRFPRINTYGVTVARAIERIGSRGIKLSCANFDLCGCIGKPVVLELIQALSGDLWCHDGAVVAITILRGREHPKWFDILKSDECGAGDSDLGRVRFLRALITREAVSGVVGVPADQWLLNSVEQLRLETYRSGTQTMLWAAFAIIPALAVQKAALALTDMAMDKDGIALRFASRPALLYHLMRTSEADLRRLWDEVHDRTVRACVAGRLSLDLAAIRAFILEEMESLLCVPQSPCNQQTPMLAAVRNPPQGACKGVAAAGGRFD